MVDFMAKFKGRIQSQILEMLALVQVEQSLPHCWIALYPATAWQPASACLYVFPPRLPVPEHCQEA